MENENITSPLLSKYLRLYEQNPFSRVFAALAENYRKLGLIDKAFEVLKEGIKNHPSYTTGYLVLASCYFDKKDYNLSYTVLRPIVDENRDNLGLQRLFAKTCVEMGYFEEALETFKYLLFINPRDDKVAAQVEFLEKRNADVMRTDFHSTKPKNITNQESRADNGFRIESIVTHPGIDDDYADNWQQVDLNVEIDSETNLSKEQDDDCQWLIDKEPDFVQGPIITVRELDDDEIYEDNSKEWSEDGPVVTHTLVDLYCSQKHFDAAMEVLEKILALNPSDEKTLFKMEEVKNLRDNSDDDSLIVAQKDEGRTNLMKCLDIALGEEDTFDQEDKKRENLEKKLNFFLKGLKDKSQNYKY